MFGYWDWVEEDLAWLIMEAEGSVARIEVKCGERERDIRPWPQPRSRRVLEGPLW